ncbi:hypothetical protein [Vibrio breoganii]|uniref:hypothetical protein n=1 Tax=Vibrio breoganii TaxID=553239 RepID=UPI000C822048|nr:hypothetical protein [Vibrio breoganii]PML92265.1 hypothetical protein BCT64_16735 [Vibrio breoganii]PMN57785.1 hypothetical protein BCT28_15480 [Vibrio breoganii]
MARNKLIITLDYELFGDGSGSVLREQINPTYHLMNIADLYGVKLTIFFEYGQYKAYSSTGIDKHNSANKMIREQLLELVKRGHDVQLHYHGQWNGSIYDKNNDAFILNLNNVDSSNLGFNVLYSEIREGQLFLEELLTKVNPNYKCCCFRSGSWAANNDSNLLKVLNALNFVIDSSVLPNVKFCSNLVNFDYSDSPNNSGYWRVKDKLNRRSEDGNIFEVPTYVVKNRFSFLLYINSKNRISRQIFSNFYSSKISERGFSVFQKIKKVLGRDYYIADVNTMSHKTLYNMISSAVSSNLSSSDGNIINPIVLVGHPKVSYGIDDLHLLFHRINDSTMEVEYSTLLDVADELRG